MTRWEVRKILLRHKLEIARVKWQVFRLEMKVYILTTMLFIVGK